MGGKQPNDDSNKSLDKQVSGSQKIDEQRKSNDSRGDGPVDEVN